jgi:hypothetical protein
MLDVRSPLCSLGSEVSLPLVRLAPIPVVVSSRCWAIGSSGASLVDWMGSPSGSARWTPGMEQFQRRCTFHEVEEEIWRIGCSGKGVGCLLAVGMPGCLTMEHVGQLVVQQVVGNRENTPFRNVVVVVVAVGACCLLTAPFGQQVAQSAYAAVVAVVRNFHAVPAVVVVARYVAREQYAVVRTVAGMVHHVVAVVVVCWTVVPALGTVSPVVAVVPVVVYLAFGATAVVVVYLLFSFQSALAVVAVVVAVVAVATAVSPAPSSVAEYVVESVARYLTALRICILGCCPAVEDLVDSRGTRTFSDHPPRFDCVGWSGTSPGYPGSLVRFGNRGYPVGYHGNPWMNTHIASSLHLSRIHSDP